LKIKIEENPKTKIKIIPVFEFKAKKNEFNGKKGKTKTELNQNQLIIYYGLGKKEKFSLNDFRKIALIGLSEAKGLEEKNFCVELIKTNFTEKELVLALSDSFLYANYFFDKYKKQDSIVEEMIIKVKPSKELNSLIDSSLKLNESVSLVKDLVNENSEIVTPLHLEKTARKVLNKKVKISVLKEKDLIKNKLNLFSAVGKAGTTPPQLTLLQYNGNPKSKKKIILVGKGITFDSGGLDLKPWPHMLDMREDMAGAATVLGIIKAASEMNLKVNLIAAMATAENLIGSKAYRPGDVLKAFNGKTVEIKNTDAEGRLVLADTLAYCEKKFKPELFIDYATLTGAVVVALSTHVAALISNNDYYSDLMFKSGEKTLERLWRLPLYDEYREEMHGERSDLQNISKTGNAGTITAGAFLENFVNEKPWIHLDIAGTAFIGKPVPGQKKGATGFGVKLTIDFLQKLIEEKKFN
jgi:leucyl aminopeptidase